MKMNGNAGPNGKTLCAAAVIGALSTVPAARAATVYDEEGTTLELYGNIQIAVSSVETAGEGGEVDAIDELADNGSTLGVRGTRAFGDGFTGYFRYEFEGDADEIKAGAGLDGGDQAYFGIEGAFGDVRIGSWDVLIDDWVQDPISNNEFFDLSDSNGRIEGDDGVNTQGEQSADREGDRLQYSSPSLAGFTAVVGLQFKGSGEEENVSDSASVAPYLGVEYEIGSFVVAAVWDSLDNFDGDVSGRTFLAPDGTAMGEYDAGDQFGVAATYTLDTLSLSAKIESYASGDDDIVPNELRFGIGARYGYGSGDVYGAYQLVDVDEVGAIELDGSELLPVVENDTTYNEVNFGVTYELFDSAYVFGEAAAYDREDSVGDGVAFGAVYVF